MAESGERQKFEAKVVQLGARSLRQILPGIYEDKIVAAAWEGWLARSEHPADSYLITKDGIQEAANEICTRNGESTGECAMKKYAAIIESKCQARNT